MAVWGSARELVRTEEHTQGKGRLRASLIGRDKKSESRRQGGSLQAQVDKSYRGVAEPLQGVHREFCLGEALQ